MTKPSAAVSRARLIAERLTEAGYSPRIVRRRNHIRIEAPVIEKDHDDPARWLALIEALSTGEQFGYRGTSEAGTAWATISTRQSRPG
jgi:hypothetical protein